jgi:hypothetical protein
MITLTSNWIINTKRYKISTHRLNDNSNDYKNGEERVKTDGQTSILRS